MSIADTRLNGRLAEMVDGLIVRYSEEKKCSQDISEMKVKQAMITLIKQMGPDYRYEGAPTRTSKHEGDM